MPRVFDTFPAVALLAFASWACLTAIIEGDQNSFQRSGSLFVVTAIVLFAGGQVFFGYFGRKVSVGLTAMDVDLKVSLLIGGTLIWGYGDLVFCWISDGVWGSCVPTGVMHAP